MSGMDLGQPLKEKRDVREEEDVWNLRENLEVTNWSWPWLCGATAVLWYNVRKGYSVGP